MNTYVNKRTGASFTTPCECAGEGWELIGTAEQLPEKPAEKLAEKPRKRAKEAAKHDST